MLACVGRLFLCLDQDMSLFPMQSCQKPKNLAGQMTAWCSA